MTTVPKPGTAIAVPHLPFTSLTTNACRARVPFVAYPPAAQLPAEAHDTEWTSAYPPRFSDPKPGTSIAVRQVPARATAPATGAAETASGAAHHTAVAPARTIFTRCRRIGSPQPVPTGPARSPGLPIRPSPGPIR